LGDYSHVGGIVVAELEHRFVFHIRSNEYNLGSSNVAAAAR